MAAVRTRVLVPPEHDRRGVRGCVVGDPDDNLIAFDRRGEDGPGSPATGRRHGTSDGWRGPT
jgi:hypothetical protein